MRKNIFVALVALCLAVPGMATVSSIYTPELVSYEMGNPEIDPQLVQDILKAAAQQCEYDYVTLQGWYDDGTVTIQKTETGYRVIISNGGGGLIIDIEETF